MGVPPIPTGKTVFDHVDEIYLTKRRNYFDLIGDEGRKSYNKFMVNRIISMNVHQLPIVDAAQRYNIPSRLHYLFYALALPKGKQWNKYLKKPKGDSTGYDEWLVDLVSRHYEVSKADATSYIEIFYASNVPALRALCEKYGVDAKLMKKAKLQ